MSESIIQLAQEQWIYWLGALVALVLIIKIFKSVIRWLFIAAVVAALIYFAMNFENGVWLEKGLGWMGKATEQAVVQTQQQAIDGIMNEIKDATYTLRADGTYEVSTSNFTLRGTVGQADAVLSYKDHEFNVQLGDQLNEVIQQAKQNSSSAMPAP